MAEMLDMSPSTLRRCEREALDGVVRRRPGRPARDPAERSHARERVREALELVGWSAGEGTVWRALDGELSLRLVREELRGLKAERRARIRRRARRERQHIEVHARDVLWAQDATHLGRDEHGGEVQAEVIREVASSRTIEVRVGRPADSRDVIAALEAARQTRGTLPLVLATDNGPAYVSDEVADYLGRNQVVHLRSLPRTPQHNAWAEHGMRELKEETGLGKGVRVRDTSEALRALLAARERLDQRRPRRSRGWRTAEQADAALPSAPDLVDRTRALDAVRCAVREAVLYSDSERERRRSSRAAVLQCLEELELITMTRGEAQEPASNRAEFRE